MDVINLGATDGLPPVNWANVVETLDAGSLLGRRTQRSHDVALDGEPGREPARDSGRCALAGRKLLVPDRIVYAEGPQRRTLRRRSIVVSIRGADVVAEGEAERG